MGDLITGLFFIFIAIGVIRFIFGLLRTGGAAVKATYDTATGRNTFSESFNESVGGFGDLTFKVIKQTHTEKGKSSDAFMMQFKGLFPYSLNNKPLSFIFNIFDKTDPKIPSVVTCPIDGLNEGHTLTFQFIRPFGPVEANQGFPKWVDLGLAPIDYLKFPKKGNLKLEFQCCVTVEGEEPKFNYGGVENQKNILQVFNYKLDYYNSKSGYLEIDENRKKVEESIIQLGFYISAVDGEIAKKEGFIISDWVKDQVSSAIEENKDNVKKRLNKNIKESYDLANRKDLALSNIVKNLNDNASTIEKYEALEIALKVMQADGIADQQELITLDNIAKEINIDPDEYKKLREQGIATVDVVAEKEDSSTSGSKDRRKEIAVKIGFDPNDNQEKIKRILIEQGKLWRGRANVSDPKIKENAKNMLLLIAEARKTFLND